MLQEVGPKLLLTPSWRFVGLRSLSKNLRQAIRAQTEVLEDILLATQMNSTHLGHLVTTINSIRTREVRPYSSTTSH